ncbi:MAG TPA: hypothetical protein VKB96_14725, partial [Gammaproteobacteria bacterium]|nr:hypothetical protein [Gammaproteobacteria bacterium]
ARRACARVAAPSYGRPVVNEVVKPNRIRQHGIDQADVAAAAAAARPTSRQTQAHPRPQPPNPFLADLDSSSITSIAETRKLLRDFDDLLRPYCILDRLFQRIACYGSG